MVFPMVTPAIIWTSISWSSRNYLFWFINTNYGVKHIVTVRIFIFCFYLFIFFTSNLEFLLCPVVNISFLFCISYSALNSSYKCMFFWLCLRYEFGFNYISLLIAVFSHKQLGVALSRAWLLSSGSIILKYTKVNGKNRLQNSIYYMDEYASKCCFSVCQD